MTTNPFKPGDKVKIAPDQIHPSLNHFYIGTNPKILTIKEIIGPLVELEEVSGTYHYVRFELVPYVDKPIEKTFEVGKRYKLRTSSYGGIYTCTYVSKEISLFDYEDIFGNIWERVLLNKNSSSFEELPEEITCEKILLVLKPKNPLSSNLNVTQSLHVTLQGARNGFNNQYKLKYNLEAAFESNYKNGKIEMIDITEKFKEACGISS